MTISPSVRNKLAGFCIVVSSLLLALPLVMDHDMVHREDPNAIAINENGAVYDKNGTLQHQSKPDLSQALNVDATRKHHSESQPLNDRQVALNDDNNSGAMVNFAVQKPQQEQSRAAAQPKEEILTVTKKPQQNAQEQRRQPKEEILTVNKKPQQQSSATKSSSHGPDVISGHKPNSRFAIQVGVFSKRSNADNVVSKIRKAGYSVYAVRVNSNGRELYRVYAGAADNRTALNDDLQKIDKLCGTKGKIVSM